MEQYLTPSNVMFSVGILGTIFGIYKSFHDPQVTLDKQQGLDRQDLDSKNILLEERMKWEKDQNEKRFTDLGIRLDNAFTLAQNHTHSVDVKVDGLIQSVQAMNLDVTKSITKLETTINERIPKS